MELNNVDTEDTCKECGSKENVYRDYMLCENCIDKLPNVTGYCSLDCRLSGMCDGSC